MRSLPRSLVAGLVLVLALGIILASAPRAAATQNRPSWTAGDYWVYARTAGGETTTVRMDVLARESITLTSGTYAVWHTRTTTTDAGGNSSTSDTWYQEGTLAVVKANFTVFFFGDVQVTFDPPIHEAFFPLAAGSEWSLNTTVELVGVTFSFNLAYSGAVIAEQDASVPAGTFRVAIVRDPSTGNAHERRSYSEGSGNYVQRETYDGGGQRVANQELTSYRYQSGSLTLVLIVVGGLVLAAILVGAIVTVRRRRAARPPGMMPPGAYPPPPMEPPQERPPGT